MKERCGAQLANWATSCAGVFSVEQIENVARICNRRHITRFEYDRTAVLCRRGKIEKQERSAVKERTEWSSNSLSEHDMMTGWNRFRRLPALRNGSEGWNSRHGKSAGWNERTEDKSPEVRRKLAWADQCAQQLAKGRRIRLHRRGSTEHATEKATTPGTSVFFV